MPTDLTTAYEVRRERMARVLAASLMGLVEYPSGDRLPPECWKLLLPKADAILFITSPPEGPERRLARAALTGADAAQEIDRLRQRLSKIAHAPVPESNTTAMILKQWAMPDDGENNG